MSRHDLPLIAFREWLKRLHEYGGAVCVVAAGNSGVRRPSWPAAFAEVISVGALGGDWRGRASFSNFGPWVDVYAPGRDLINAYTTGTYECHVAPYAGDPRHFYGMAKWSGTSFSTPIVSGLIAARMSDTGENARQAAAAVLAEAQAHAIPGVGPVLLPCCHESRAPRPPDECGCRTSGIGLARAEPAKENEAWTLKPGTGPRTCCASLTSVAARSYRPAPYPTVLHIHGGPFAAHGEIFNLDNLLLTAAGYGVLSVNFRGGSGYGDAHAAMLIGDWGRYDLADLLQGVEVAVERGLADGDRVASFGLSGGGYLTAWLLTHSDRFRAGVAECLVSDWVGMLGSDIPHVIATWMDSQPGGGESAMAPYIRMAPSSYAAQCSAPLLVLEHEADLRCPVSQGDILYNELKLAGKQAEMLRLPGVPHSPFAAGLRLRVERAEALLEWMDRYLRHSTLSL